MKWFVAILASAAVAGVLSHETRITNGQVAIRGQFPYQVSIQWGVLFYEHLCGGSIISPSYILTAAHCATQAPIIGFLRAVAGIIDLKEIVHERQISHVKRKYVHPKYRTRYSPYDIAVFELRTPFTFSLWVQPIALPTHDEIPEGNTTISGWGSTSTRLLPRFPNKLQFVDLPLVTKKECIRALKEIGTQAPLGETNICTGPIDTLESPCFGDSGGPLEQNGTLVGIVSWGVWPCGMKGAPSVYVRVSGFIHFIKSYVSE